MFKKLQDAAKEAMERQNKMLDVLKQNSSMDLQQQKQKPAVDLLADDEDGIQAPLPVLTPQKPIPQPTRQESQYVDAQTVDEKYKMLLIERKRLDNLVRETTPLDGLSDLEGFENHLRSLIMQKTASSDEIKRLTGIMNGKFCRLFERNGRAKGSIESIAGGSAEYKRYPETGDVY